MASHYVAASRPVSNQTNVDALTVGTSSASTAELELRVLDGAGLTEKDVLVFLEMCQNFILDRRVSSAFSVNP